MRTMCFYISFLLTSLYLTVTADMMEIQTGSGEDCKLQCTAILKPGVQYRAVRWYKINNSSQQNGLLTRDLPNGTTRMYVGVEREVRLLGDSLNILLPNVTCEDSGVYICYMAAPVGQQIREGRVLLTVTDCPVEATENKWITDVEIIAATAVLMFALVALPLYYKCMKNSIKGKKKMPKTEELLDSSPHHIDKKDLMLIYTLGPKPTMKHICV